MSILLCARKLLGILNGTTPRESCVDKEECTDKDVTCQSFVIFAIDKKLMHRLMNCHISNQMWHCLCTVYEQNAMKNIQLL